MHRSSCTLNLNIVCFWIQTHGDPDPDPDSQASWLLITPRAYSTVGDGTSDSHRELLTLFYWASEWPSHPVSAVSQSLRSLHLTFIVLWTQAVTYNIFISPRRELSAVSEDEIQSWQTLEKKVEGNRNRNSLTVQKWQLNLCHLKLSDWTDNYDTYFNIKQPPYWPDLTVLIWFIYLMVRHNVCKCFELLLLEVLHSLIIN